MTANEWAAIGFGLAIGYGVVWSLSDRRKAAPDQPETRREPESASDEETPWYLVLGVSATASDAEVVAAYHHLASQYHPDKVSHLAPEFAQLADRKMQRINQAYAQALASRGVPT